MFPEDSAYDSAAGAHAFSSGWDAAHAGDVDFSSELTNVDASDWGLHADAIWGLDEHVDLPHDGGQGAAFDHPVL